MSTTYAPHDEHTLYVEVEGTTCFLPTGVNMVERGTVRGLLREQGHLVGAFVSSDDRAFPVTWLARLGARRGKRRQHAVVVSVEQVDRDRFDELTGLTELRRELGWRQ